MKNKTLYILFVFLFTKTLCAQGTWTQKADFGVNANDGRALAVSFSIGTNGFICAGRNQYTGVPFQDLWAYDTLANAWTQKAVFPGGFRIKAVGFSVNGKGYVGGGDVSSTNMQLQDFWEYDPGNNSWIQKANLPSSNTYYAAGISIGSKGYVSQTSNNYFWQYNPATDSWAQKSSLPDPSNAIAGFSIGSKGYILPGNSVNFWEYDTLTDLWIQKTNFRGAARSSAVSFSIGNKGYLGTGTAFDSAFWEYNPSNDSWCQKTNFPSGNRSGASGFSIGNRGYVGVGNDPNYFNFFPRSFWCFTPDTGCITTGISKQTTIQENKIKVYPNPIICSATIIISTCSNRASACSVKIYNSTGEDVTSSVTIGKPQYFSDEIKIPFNKGKLTPGIYFYKIEFDNQKNMGSGKLIIQ